MQFPFSLSIHSTDKERWSKTTVWFASKKRPPSFAVWAHIHTTIHRITTDTMRDQAGQVDPMAMVKKLLQGRTSIYLSMWQYQKQRTHVLVDIHLVGIN